MQYIRRCRAFPPQPLLLKNRKIRDYINISIWILSRFSRPSYFRNGAETENEVKYFPFMRSFLYISFLNLHEIMSPSLV